MDIVIEGNLYRLAWRDNWSGKGVQKGTFLFNEPIEALEARNNLQQMFPQNEIWLEDRAGNKVLIPEKRKE